MGEIADDIIEGSCCALCGQYFIDPEDDEAMFQHGHPVVCDSCWTPDCGYEKAIANTF